MSQWETWSANPTQSHCVSGLKIPWAHKARTGSSPVSGTTCTSDSSSGCFLSRILNRVAGRMRMAPDGLGLFLEQFLHESYQFAYLKRFFQCV